MSEPSPRPAPAHVHSHDDERGFEDRLRSLLTRRTLLVTVLLTVAVTVIGLVVLWPGEVEPVTTLEGENYFGEPVNADVTAVRTGDCSYSSTPGEFTCDQVDFVVTSGTPEGEEGSLELSLGLAGGGLIEDGDQVILSYSGSAPAEAQFQFSDFQRSSPMILLVILFGVAVVALGRWRGLFALVGVVISFVVLVGFVLPALLDGRPPLAVALVGTSAVAVPALYLAHGISERTSVALLGTVSSLLITCLLGVLFVKLTSLTGLASEEVGFLQAFGGNLDFAGLLLAGLVIGALGVLDDVTVTQVAAVWELRDADPTASPTALYRSGLRIGRDHIASTVNTLLLAYAGASLPLLLLFRTSGRSLGTVITSESVAVEVVRALVGSIGLVASVPITTGLAALVVTRDASGHQPPTKKAVSLSGRDKPPQRAPRWDDFAPDTSSQD